MRWFTDPALTGVSAEYDERETTWAGLLSLEILLATQSGDPHTFLDIGCGGGALLEALGTRHPTCALRGLDVSPAAVRRTRARLEGRPDVTVWEAAADELTDDRFAALRGQVDIALVHLNLGLWPDPVAGLRAAVTTLAPGGHCYVVDLARPERIDPAADILSTEAPAEREYLAAQLAASLSADEASAVVREVTKGDPAITGFAAVGGFGGHPFGSPAATALWKGSAALRSLLASGQENARAKTEQVVHLWLQREPA